VQGCVDPVDNGAEIFRFVPEVEIVHIEDQELAQIVGFHPGFIPFVQMFQVIEPYVVLIFPSPALDLVYQGRNRCAQVNEQVGRFDKGTHQVKQCEVIFEVTCGHQAHAVEVRCEDIGILIDGPVLDDIFARLADLDDLAEPAVQKIDLQVERPALHVLVKVIEIGIIIHVFILGFPGIMLG